MRVLLLCAGTTAALLLASLAARADSPPTPAPQATRVAANSATPTSSTAAAASSKKPAQADKSCLHTGTMIAGRCAIAHGSVYTHQDLQHTGRITLGGQLRELDPSLTVGH
jgi:hypothetical protein